MASHTLTPEAMLHLRYEKESEWPRGKAMTLRHPLVQETIGVLRQWRAYGKRTTRSELKKGVEDARRDSAREKRRRELEAKGAWVEAADFGQVEVHGATVRDKQFQAALRVLERESVILYKIDPDPEAKWCPPVRDLQSYRAPTVGIQGRHERGTWMITDFDSRRYLMLEIPTEEPGQTFEIRMHFNEDLRAEDYEDLQSALFRNPSKWGEVLQKLLPEGREEPFRCAIEIRRVKYEMLTHNGFYSHFYAKFPDLDVGAHLAHDNYARDFVTARISEGFS